MKIKHLLLIISFLLSAQFLSAKLVTIEKASIIAKNFYYQQSNSYYESIEIEEVNISSSNIHYSDNKIVYYTFNINEDSYVIVSADDNFHPVLAYSFEGALENGNKNFDGFMQHYAQEIIFSMEQTQTDEIFTQWKRYSQADIPLTMNIKNSKEVTPLLPCLWNQDNPYNELCPEATDGPNGKVLAGCVATAMSMIMYYYKYPLQGSGSNSYYLPGYGVLTANFGATQYDWNAMLDEISMNSGNPIIGIAELMYHCGVSVDMNYSADGSGAYSQDVPNAVKTYFNYSNNCNIKSKGIYSLSAWKEMIFEQIDAGHPLYYSGHDSDGGHAFCLDGYQDDDYFHFNFGWSGSNNGYFMLVGTDAVGGFNQGQKMVINFYPDESQYPYNCSGQTTITDTDGTLEDGSGPVADYTENTYCTWLIAPEDFVQKITIEFLDFDLDNSDVLTIYDGEDANADVLGTFTGSDIPDEVNSTQTKLYIVFETDGSNNSQGWRMAYSSQKPIYCTSMNTLPDDTGIVDDGSGDSDYNNNSVCKFLIGNSSNSQITLHFTKFDLEEGDRINILTGTGQAAGTFTGSSLPSDLTLPSGNAWIMFFSNYLYTANGWEVEWESTVGTENNDVFSFFRTSPNPTQSILNVSFELKKPERVELGIIRTNGETIYKEEFDESIFYQTQIDLSTYSSGIYFVIIKTETQEIIKKIIKI